MEWFEDELGVDEVGRGPLAGPVVVAAVWLPPGFDLTGLGDSKALTERQRQPQAARTRTAATCHVVAMTHEDVDQFNVLGATEEGMRRAVAAIQKSAPRAAIDGNRVPPGLALPGRAIVKGDRHHAAIAAASILAKVERDAYMIAAGRRWPQYGFEKHKGYPSPTHLEALNRYGPCPIHRRSFAPVRQAERQGCLVLNP